MSAVYTPDSDNSDGEITVLLNQLRAGDESARSAAFTAIYGQLRRMAAGYMARESSGSTLQPTALVHEAYLKLLGHTTQIQNRGHFLALAAEAMRRILVDRARARMSQKRGGEAIAVTLDENIGGPLEDPEKVLAVEHALARLERIDPRRASVVTMRFFAGLTEAEIAESLGMTVRTVRRDWAVAKAWLYAEIS